MKWCNVWPWFFWTPSGQKERSDTAVEPSRSATSNHDYGSQGPHIWKKVAFIVYCCAKPFKIGITAKPNASTQRMTPSEKSFHFPPPSFGKKYPDKQEPTKTPIDLYEKSRETLSSLEWGIRETITRFRSFYFADHCLTFSSNEGNVGPGTAQKKPWATRASDNNTTNKAVNGENPDFSVATSRFSEFSLSSAMFNEF